MAVQQKLPSDCRCDDPGRKDGKLFCEHCRNQLAMIARVLREEGVEELRVTQVTTTDDSDGRSPRLLGQPLSTVANEKREDR